MSGRPGRRLSCRRNRRPQLCRYRLTANSGAVSTGPIPAIIRERVFRSTISAIVQITIRQVARDSITSGPWRRSCLRASAAGRPAHPLEGTPNSRIAERAELLGIGACFVGRQVRRPGDARTGIDACGIVAVAAIGGGCRRAARQTIGPAGWRDSLRRVTGGRRSAGTAGTRAGAVAGGRTHGPAILALTVRKSHAHRSAPCREDNPSRARTTCGCGCSA